MISRLLSSLFLSLVLAACDGLPLANNITQTAPAIITAYTTEAPVYSDKVLSTEYTDDYSLLENMEYTDHSYAYQDGRVYYRRYHADSFEAGAVWGYYKPIAGTNKEIVSIDADGSITELFSDKGYGNIYLINDRFYMTEVRFPADSYVYSVDMQGQNRIDYGCGNICAADAVQGILILKLLNTDTNRTCYYALNCGTGKQTLLADGTSSDLSFCTFQDGRVYFDWHLYENACSLIAVSPEGERRELITLTSEDKDLTYSEHIFQVEIFADRIFFCFGGYSGTAHNYQGGRFITIKPDGSDYRAIEVFGDNAENQADCYYLCEDSGRPLLYFSGNAPQHQAYNTEVWDIEANEIFYTDFPEQILHEQRQTTHLPESAGRTAIQALNGKSEVYALPDSSGSIVRIAPSMEPYIQTAITADTCFKHFYFADGFLYFIAEFNKYDDTYSVGWRDGCRRIRTELYRMRLGENTAELLYAY